MIDRARVTSCPVLGPFARSCMSFLFRERRRRKEGDGSGARGGAAALSIFLIINSLSRADSRQTIPRTDGRTDGRDSLSAGER